MGRIIDKLKSAEKWVVFRTRKYEVFYSILPLRGPRLCLWHLAHHGGHDLLQVMEIMTIVIFFLLVPSLPFLDPEPRPS
jgi:hypothetical protein